ncbi:malto-oligosyltrehalose trehalohydrolase [Pseudomonas sp. PIC25]|uniref:malto-oligosyltrehalose trehalohydrolase n=1 Tax=Pseudomonas sp. PIC25 TaxID=1958773 RepID=UPI000BAC075D|nr:malto-oligosyltrehalose trehalohydrolase [Pseudomonas sp. PIC25]PAU63081.1 malto-oligosyltrehalose trehalohydrolase [Pseudomonas sp. PIC25]
MSVHLTHTCRHGATPINATHTRFALWAPDARQVSVRIVGGDSLPMRAEADGWFVLEAPYGAGTLYRYQIDDDLLVPDPASRAQAGDILAPSIVVDPYAYAWRHETWRGRPWHETVLYELHVGLLGGFAGVEAELPRLAELGITAIELMPVAEFPGERNWGYDGVLPYAPEAAYGPPEALKRLVDTAHGLGLMVFLDVVYNHFGPDGNFLGQYAGAFFREDRHTPWGAAIDFRRREVRDFFIDNALMWVQDYRIDGLRLDAVHAIDDESFLCELAQRMRAAVEPDRYVHLVLENEHNSARLLEQGYDAQWNDDGHNVLHALLTGERESYYANYCQDPTGKLARCLAEGFVYQGEPNRHGTPRGEPSAHLEPVSFVLFLQNHDQIGNRAFGERLISLCDPEALRAATTLLLLSPMVPLLFMGEEWGARQPFLFFTSHHGELADAVREGRRNEFRDFAAFADAETRARIPDPNAESTFAASRPDRHALAEPGHAEWLALYRELLDIRQRVLFPRLPGCRALGAEVLGDGAVTACWRLGDGSRLRIELNLGAQAVDAPSETSGAVLFQSCPGGFDDRRLGHLPARLALVYFEEAL